LTLPKVRERLSAAQHAVTPIADDGSASDEQIAFEVFE
jgi:hypothetical protein